MSRAAAHRHGPNGHSHGVVDPSIKRSREGLRAVGVSLAVLALAAAAQVAIFLLTGSVALLADLIHNFGDALTAIPLGIAFLLRSDRAEQIAGLFVVAAILVSALVAGYEAVLRLVEPDEPSHLLALASAGVIGFGANLIAARIRTCAGRRLDSAALIADGDHARADAYVSLGVVASAFFVGVGLGVADALIGLTISLVILRITWQSWNTIRGAALGKLDLTRCRRRPFARAPGDHGPVVFCSRTDTYGQAVTEVQASGLPVVAVDEGVRAV